MRVSKNAYYNWHKNTNLVRTKNSVMLLKERIRAIFEDSKEIYGSYKIQKMLERENLNYSRYYIAILMKEMELKSVLRRKFVNTTDSKHNFPIAKNELDRGFSTSIIGEKWVSDITYIRVNDRWNYLTTITDLADRKVIGWALGEDLTLQNTVLKAWCHARRTREISNNFIFHSDRGVQYAAHTMTNIFSFNSNITQSMSRNGNCWDNAIAESFFKTIKHEWLYRFKFTS